MVSRADRIGDLVLTLPAIAWLKRCTGAHITLHCSSYASDIGHWAQHNGVVDALTWADSKTKAWVGLAESYDYFLSFFHCSESAQLARRLSVKGSLGPRTKIAAMWTYGKTIAQHRSRVEMSEMHYNVALARAALRIWNMPVEEFTGLGRLEVPAPWLSGYIPPREWVVSLSNGGSAQNWSVAQYLEWLAVEGRERDVDFLVSGIDAELRRRELEAWSGFDSTRHRIVTSLPSVGHLVGYLSQARRLVASSTGPLHIAHAAGVPVFGVYPKKKVESFARWRPDGYWHDAELKWIEIN